MQLKLSKDEALYLKYLVQTEGDDSRASFLRRTLHEFFEGEGAHCLDPTRSKYRAWLLRHDRTTPTARCQRGKKGPACGPCAAWMAEVMADSARRDAEAAA